MKRFSEQLNKKAQSVRLRSAEKRELRERVVSYMEYHPLPFHLRTKMAKKSRTTVSPLLTESFKTFHIPFNILFKTSAVVVAVVLVVIPFVAEKAVPGDTLYAVKVQFNEELRSTLTFDGYEKVEWEATRLSRRISEARLLASEGRLTEEVEAEVAEAVKVHTENAQREIDELRTHDADEAMMASIALDTTLEVQASSFLEETIVSPEGSVEVKSTNLIADAIDESRSQGEARNASTSLPSFEKLMARIEQNTTRIHELSISLIEIIPEEELAEVRRRTEDIGRAIQEAVALVESDEEESRRQLVGILQRTQKLIVYMTELEVKKTVDIETLVPVVLTDDEEATITKDLTEQVAKQLVEIDKLSLRLENKDVLAKVEFAKTSITKLYNQMNSATDFDTFEALAKEALSLAGDTKILLEQNIVSGAEFVDKETSSSTDGVINAGVNDGEVATSSETQASLPANHNSSLMEIRPEYGDIVAPE
ncbi:hypothetical protein KC865_03450 [Candidatus Kaiserbacteria bacterium]|nr:hypothetical protein [Candidatus Kaiserbacteria bacterium]USN92513.1 MAG: hypothetical protein H6782_01710 [Candidatus Nomurabacteria bacterium]